MALHKIINSIDLTHGTLQLDHCITNGQPLGNITSKTCTLLQPINVHW